MSPIKKPGIQEPYLTEKARIWFQTQNYKLKSLFLNLALLQSFAAYLNLPDNAY